ncbi:MAG: STAS domain-containing protein [Anaeromyxobacter sp.]
MSNTHQPLLVRVDGVFDLPAAQRLAHTLRDAQGKVRIDLTHVREFHDYGVTVLAHALAGRRSVEVSGLRQHHVRLLRYLGVDAGADHGAEAETY